MPRPEASGGRAESMVLPDDEEGEDASDEEARLAAALTEKEKMAFRAVRSRLVREELPYTLNKIIKLLQQIMMEIDPATGGAQDSARNGTATPPILHTSSLGGTTAYNNNNNNNNNNNANESATSNGVNGRRTSLLRKEENFLQSSAASTASGPAVFGGSPGNSVSAGAAAGNGAEPRSAHDRLPTMSSARSTGSGASGTSSRAARLPSPLQILRNRPSSRASSRMTVQTPVGAASAIEPPVTATNTKLATQVQMQQAQVASRFANPEGGLHMSHKHTKSSGLAQAQGQAGASPMSMNNGLRNLTRKGFHVGLGGATSSAAPSVSYSTSSSTWMDVSLLMDGYYVRHADIDLRLHRPSRSIVSRRPGFVASGSHHHFHTQLHQPHHPWMLDQVYEVYNQARMQVEKLEGFLETLHTGEGGDMEGASPPPASEMPSEQQTLDAQHCLHDLVVALTEARNVMTNPSPKTFPQVLRPADTRGGCEFKPCPPQEILIDFSVHLNDLIVTAYELSYFAQGNSKETSVLADSWVQTCDYTNKVFRFSDPSRTVQVVDQVQVHFKVHSLKWVMESIYEAYNTAIRMLRKLESLNKHDMALKFNGGPAAEAEARRIQDEMKKFGSIPALKYSNWITG
ncbi:Protein rogdi-like [Hondaea fermentalgiana]|uniref:Protein rogdi-like n=1 Tax=Hondaea fermentalgiana TaxID=2315210 RepID=A0A2R5G262_9STRA|nr:Protein rogdi-like [Hondaea fermentalgiana]|eukprot:GBG24625.1 Protein rogdi-like [Hondaea fermentalgiana]